MTTNANETNFVATPWGLVPDMDHEDCRQFERASQTFAEPHTVLTKEDWEARKARAIEQFKARKSSQVFQRLADELNRLNTADDPDWGAWYSVDCVTDWNGNLNLRSSLKVGNDSATTAIDVDCVRTRLSPWRSAPTDKLFVTITRNGHQTRFNELKDGSFRYNDMATLVRHVVQDQRVSRAADRQRAKNEAVAGSFRAGRKASYGTVRVMASPVEDKPLMVNVSLNRAMTEAEAAELYALFEKNSWL